MFEAVVKELKNSTLRNVRRAFTQEEEDYAAMYPCNHVPYTHAHEKLPIFLFIAGVEGSGHHALVTVWQELRHYYPIVRLAFFVLLLIWFPLRGLRIR